MTDLKLAIEGMTCGGCVKSVTTALQRVDGVTDVSVTLDPGAAELTFDAAKTDEGALRKVIEAAGFDVPS